MNQLILSALSLGIKVKAVWIQSCEETDSFGGRPVLQVNLNCKQLDKIRHLGNPWQLPSDRRRVKKTRSRCSPSLSPPDLMFACQGL